MTNEDQRERDKIQATMERVVDRLRTDPDFSDRVKADPIAALTSAGLPEEAVTEFVRQIGTSADVSGYLLNNEQVIHSYAWPMCT